jgi:hypothetical protein
MESPVTLDWADLLIEDLDPADCERWLGFWGTAVSGRFRPELLNKFGSWFLRRPDGPVEMLDVFTGKVEKVASDHEEFVRLVNEPAWQEVHLLSRVVLDLHRRGKVPGPGQCYALAPHPASGGPDPARGDAIDPRFVFVMEIEAWQSICAQSVQGAGGEGAR